MRFHHTGSWPDRAAACGPGGWRGCSRHGQAGLVAGLLPPQSEQRLASLSGLQARRRSGSRPVLQPAARQVAAAQMPDPAATLPAATPAAAPLQSEPSAWRQVWCPVGDRNAGLCLLAAVQQPTSACTAARRRGALHGPGLAAAGPRQAGKHQAVLQALEPATLVCLHCRGAHSVPVRVSAPSLPRAGGGASRFQHSARFMLQLGSVRGAVCRSQWLLRLGKHLLVEAPWLWRLPPLRPSTARRPRRPPASWASARCMPSSLLVVSPGHMAGAQHPLTLAARRRPPLPVLAGTGVMISDRAQDCTSCCRPGKAPAQLPARWRGELQPAGERRLQVVCVGAADASPAHSTRCTPGGCPLVPCRLSLRPGSCRTASCAAPAQALPAPRQDGHPLPGIQCAGVAFSPARQQVAPA